MCVSSGSWSKDRACTTPWPRFFGWECVGVMSISGMVAIASKFNAWKLQPQEVCASAPPAATSIHRRTPIKVETINQPFIHWNT
eukprot:m.8238 g.8238  ORF g.8238 m.8238 type:complete len:84 (+) comp5337_c0_seq1:2792-3043(+)